MKLIYVPFFLTLVSCIGSELYFDPTKHSPLEKSFIPFKNQKISSAAISPDGKAIVIGTENGKTALFYPFEEDKDLIILETPFTEKTSNSSAIKWVAVSPDVSSIVAVQESQDPQKNDYSTLYYWKTFNHKKTSFKKPFVFDYVHKETAPVFSSDNQFLIFPRVSSDPEDKEKFLLSHLTVLNIQDLTIPLYSLPLIHMIDLNESVTIPNYLFINGLNKLIPGNSSSLKKSFIVAIGNKNTAHLFDLVIQRESSLSPYHSGWITTAAFNHDDTALATGSDDTTIRLWDLKNQLGTPTADDKKKTRTPFLKELKSHKKTVTKILFTKEGSSLISADLKGTINLWNTATGLLQKTFVHSPQLPITHLSLTPDERHLLAVDIQGNVTVWDIVKQILIYFIPFESLNETPVYWGKSSFSFHKNPNVLAAKILRNNIIILVTRQKIIIKQIPDNDEIDFYGSDYLG